MKVEYCASAIRALINAGADKTIRDNNDETALDIAFAQGVPNIVHELLRVKPVFISDALFVLDVSWLHRTRNTIVMNHCLHRTHTNYFSEYVKSNEQDMKLWLLDLRKSVMYFILWFFNPSYLFF